MIGLCLPHPRYTDDFASHGTTDGILLHLMQVRHRFSVPWWSFASMCSSSGHCLLTRRNHINIHMCSRSDCWRGKLLKSSSSCSFDTLSVSSRNSCANLILILAIFTAAATRPAFLSDTTWSTTCERLRHVFFSSSQAIVRAYLQVSTMPARRAGICF